MWVPHSLWTGPNHNAAREGRRVCGRVDPPMGTIPGPSASKHSRVPFTSTCIALIPPGIPSPTGQSRGETGKAPEHAVQHPWAAARIERSERHRWVIRISGVDEEGSLIERAQLSFVSLVLDRERAAR